MSVILSHFAPSELRGTQYLRARTTHFVLVLTSNSTVAERGGFEPPRAFQLYSLSKRAH